MAYSRSLRNEDYIQKLADYINKRKDKYPMDTLRWALIKQEHTRTCVEKAIEVAAQQAAARVSKPVAPVEPKVEFCEEPQEERKGFFARLFGM
ncbi:MAG: hypothetical protein V1660_02405 [archaeon]